jgi:hypothetical protein
MPKVIKLYNKSKGSLKHNQGPINPITKKEVSQAGGNLETAYRKRAARGEGRAMDVVERIEEVGGTQRKLTKSGM